MASENLLSELYADSIDHDELLGALARHYGGARHEFDLGISYPSHGPAALIVVGNDRIDAIHPGPAFDKSDFGVLREKVRADLLPTGLRSIVFLQLFADLPVGAYYEAPDRQILIGPVPNSAPRPDEVYADHPFLIWYGVPASPNAFVTGARADKIGRRWTLFLNAILIDGARLPSRSATKHWVLCTATPFADDPSSNIRLEQEMYFCNVVPPVDGGFPVADPLLPVVETNDYYSRLGIGPDTTFSIPTIADALIATYLALPDEARIRFDLACRWFAAAQDLWGISRDAAFVTHVSAVEALAAELVMTGTVCRTCGLERGKGPTARFRLFVERYAPGVDPDMAGELYRFRGRLVHGVGALHERSSGQVFKASVLEEDAESRRLAHLVRATLINWLLSKASPVPTA